MDDKNFQAMLSGIITAQGTSFALYHILLELTMRFAETQPDPSDFVKSMFEAVMRKLDQGDLQVQKKESNAWERETISTFFSVAEGAVRRRASRRGSSGPQKK
jgi:hypothetical protein